MRIDTLFNDRQSYWITIPYAAAHAYKAHMKEYTVPIPDTPTRFVYSMRKQKP